MQNERKKLEELNLLDDFLFNAMMTYPEMGEKFTRKILKLLFNKEFRNLKVIAQKSYGGLNTDLRGARLDVYVESDDSAEIDASEDASIYDLEPDKNDKAKYIAAFPQRIRFYHATEIQLNKSHNKRDFGTGFYTTILEEQAREWAYRLSLRNHSKDYYVMKFLFAENEELKIKRFDSLSIEWLEFIKENRSRGRLQHDYDVVIGPVADDNTMETVQLYIAGILNAEEAVNRLRYNKVNNQVSFHTQKALEYLRFVGRDRYE